MEFKHIPVLLNEVLENLDVQPGEKYIDATLGGGGHGFEILKRGGILLGIDQDQDAIEFVKSRIKNEELGFDRKNITIARGNFENIESIAKENGFTDARGILFDLGVSSYQIGQSGRGFSFREDAPLDMRMSIQDKDEEITAEDIINTWSIDALDDLFSRYGEEENSRKIAKKIGEAREKKQIKTSLELADVIMHVVPKHGMTHPATRVFQALRIQVNREMEVLKKGLAEGFNIVAHDGKVVVISFHSLEDRIVKNLFREWESQGTGQAIQKKPIIASEQEIAENPRSRSAKLRAIRKM